MLEQFLKLPKDRQQYISKFPDGTAVSFRLLTLSESKYLQQLRKSLDLDEDTYYSDIFNICVSEEWKNIGGQVKAGIPKSIGLYIEFQSNNYQNFEAELNSVRMEINPSELSEYMKNVIMYATSSYKYEDLDNLDRMNLIRLFSRCENLLIMKTEGKYEPFNYKKATRKQTGIDFARENAEINRTTHQAQKPGEDLLRLREAASAKQQQRIKRIKENG